MVAGGNAGRHERDARVADVVSTAPDLLATDHPSLTDQRGHREGTLPELFAARVARHPDQVAVVCGHRMWTYAELDAVTTRVAHRLRAVGARPGTFVAVHFERSERPIIAILACLKTGAAYVPIDPSYPAERIAHIVTELTPVARLTETSLLGRAGEAYGQTPTLVLDEGWDRDGWHVDYRPEAPAGVGDVAPDDLAYVIYTSGTTGRPKGVMAEHRHVTRYVEAFNQACGTGLEDRVYQGFSLSFDGSVEEIWMAFSNGSTLVVPTHDAPRFGADLGDYLTELGVTYFSTVPTMLATIDAAPSLRTIVLSGEVCPPELVRRWARDNLRLLNVYGPTEATVNTTIAHCLPDRPVTIGRPLRGYDVHIVDEHLFPVPPGTKGELLISGPTLARGYLNQPELTAKQFVTDVPIEGVDRAYRTGDLVRLGDDGDLEFFGRIDTQVKIRGYRVELAEIESVLREDPRVKEAVVRLVEREGLQQLAACVTQDSSVDAPTFDRDRILGLLEGRLPAYMVPAYLDVIDVLPRTTSGKIDRNALPAPTHPLVRVDREVVTPRTLLEEQIAGVWRELLGVEAVSVTDDFFLDLGGYSLLAAQMATALRPLVGRSVAVRDVYEFPTLEALAARIETMPLAGLGAPVSETDDDSGTRQRPFTRVSLPRRATTYVLQALSMYLLAAMATTPLAMLFVVLRDWTNGVNSPLRAVLLTMAILLLTWPAFLTIAISAKWIIIGRYKPGDYPLWGYYYWRWWLVNRLQGFSGLAGLAGTPLQSVVFRLMGAKVGRGCTIDSGHCSAWDLLTIGSQTSIGADSQFLCYRVENGLLRLGTVEIGDRCFVGLHSAIGLGVRMGDDSRLEDQSLLPDGTVVPDGEGRAGAPAQPASVPLPTARSGRHRRVLRSRNGLPRRGVRRWWFAAVHLVCASLLASITALPGLAFLVAPIVSLIVGGWAGLFGALVLAVPLGVIMSCLVVALARRVVLGRIEPERYPVESWLYVRKWLSDGLMAASRTMLLPVYTTLYLPPWLRLMGAQIGPRAELSTVWKFAPELIDVGAESFFADGSIVGGRRVHQGTFQISCNRIGRRSFVGNGAVLPVGSSLGDGCLLGVQSIPPRDPPTTPDGTDWLGAPSFRLTHRAKVGGFDDAVTYHPTRKLYAQRAIIDALRILIPGYIGLSSFVAWVGLMYLAFTQWGMWATFALAPVASFGLALCAVVVVAALKKVVMGTFRPVIKPLWSMYVWLNEMVNGAFESVAAPALTTMFGTPFVAPFLRLMGCRIGRRAYIATALFSEWDLVEIGDDVALNHGVVVQNHLFEDRVFKSSHLVVGSQVSVGNMTVLLYDSVIEDGATVGPLSLVMKGETLAAGTSWHGIPTVRDDAPLHV